MANSFRLSSNRKRKSISIAYAARRSASASSRDSSSAAAAERVATARQDSERAIGREPRPDVGGSVSPSSSVSCSSRRSRHQPIQSPAVSRASPASGSRASAAPAPSSAGDDHAEQRLGCRRIERSRARIPPRAGDRPPRARPRARSASSARVVKASRSRSCARCTPVSSARQVRASNTGSSARARQACRSAMRWPARLPLSTVEMYAGSST